jgi:diguanylate cyclase (GGDEF)-like protein/PAS domain S-box-containing protein
MQALVQRILGRAARPSSDGVHETVRRAQIAFLACALLAIALLGWSTWDHVHTAFELQRALGVQVAETAKNRLRTEVRDMQGRLSTFIHHETELLDGVAAHPDSTELRDSLWSIMQLVLPRVGSALVLDANGIRSAPLGEPLGQDSEIFLREFARGREGPFHISRRGSSLSLNLAATWREVGQATGAILVDVSCTRLCSAIERTVPEGHHLHIRAAALAVPDRAASGGPSEPAQDDGILLARVPLDGTDWVLEDRLHSGYFSRIIYQRIAFAIGLGAAFLIAALGMSRWAAGRSRDEPQEREDPRETATQEQLRSVLSATMDGIMVADPEGHIRLFNPAAEMMFGRLTEDVLNASVEKLLPDLFTDGTGAPLLGPESGRSAPVARETVGVRKGGKNFPVRVWLHAVHFGGEPRLLIVVEDLTERLRNEEQLAFLEQRDVLTELLNRKEFEQRLSAILSDASDRPSAHHVLCHIDVDQFKLINDTCGYQAGDELLRQLAILIRARLGEAELIARLGGDEFGALLLNRTAEQGLEICEGFRQTVRAFLFTWRDRSFDVAVSIGLVQFTPQSDSPSSILSKADVACQMAKTRGRDRVHVYSQADVELIRHHGDMRLVSTISQALSQGRFQLYAQPISPVAPGSGKHRHFEVLARMVDGSGEQLIPGRFIPAAERYILMPSIDRWIINRLFSLQAENLRAWHGSPGKGFLFAVNLSGTSITDEGFLRYLKRQFIDWRVPHDTICFEITETAAIRNLASARAFMQELSALGCTFALDDFGTGLSSYGYLKELPVDYLKIDGSFVRGMTEDPVSYALVESINQIGHVLGLKTIAEWAEDKNILNQLRALNVDFAQGFGIGQAIPVCDFTIAHTTEPFPHADQSNDPLRDTQPTSRSLARPA